MTTLPFPEAAIGPTIFLILGFLLATTTILTIYTLKLRKTVQKNKTPDKKDKLNTAKLNIGNSTKDILEEIIREPQLQSDLPDNANVSKATVSQSIKELKNKGYIKRKKRGNTYLIEPRLENLEEECGK